jgi:2-polyprenyl-6-methoxyphenol hydroxylase-like FAD-dependent oxidoreductase
VIWVARCRLILAEQNSGCLDRPVSLEFHFDGSGTPRIWITFATSPKRHPTQWPEERRILFVSAFDTEASYQQVPVRRYDLSERLRKLRHRTMKHVPVLIVGAGPTGLNLALSLARRGVPFRLITESEGPGEHSRAMVVQARTLEFYGQYGFADEMIEQGVRAGAAHLREGGDDGRGREVVSFSFKDLGEGLSPYPFALAYPQDDHERFLVAKLNAAGGAVEWRSQLTSFRQDGDGVRAAILRDGQTEEAEAFYICGCDGARSDVRETLGVGFPGGTYDQLFFVADVRIDRGFERDLYINLGEHILMLMFPVRSSGMQRLIGLVPPELSRRSDLTFEDIRGQAEKLLDIRVTEVILRRQSLVFDQMHQERLRSALKDAIDEVPHHASRHLGARSRRTVGVGAVLLLLLEMSLLLQDVHDGHDAGIGNFAPLQKGFIDRTHSRLFEITTCMISSSAAVKVVLGRLIYYLFSTNSIKYQA